MTDRPDHQHLAREAKAIVALAFRNGPIEDIHADRSCPACNAKSDSTRITDAEMKRIMKNAVNRVYALLRLKAANPETYEREIAFGVRNTLAWDDPEEPTATRC